MEKVVFVAHVADDVAIPDEKAVVTFNEQVLEELDPARYPGITFQVADAEANEAWLRSPRLIPGQAVAVLSVWTEAGDDFAEIEAAVAPFSPRRSGLVVTESVARWSSGHATSATEFQPGYTIVAVMARKPELTKEEFEQHWITGHMPDSLRIHPARNYVRNVRARALTPGAEAIDGISDEGVGSLQDIVDPLRFYGAAEDPSLLAEHQRIIKEDIPKFLDVTRAGATITREYRLRDFRS